MTLETWLSFCVLEVLLCLTPGPAVIFTTTTALRRGGKAALAGIGGILASNTLYFALSATGVAAVILASSDLFTALRWLGGAYLIWLGLRMIPAARAGAPERPPRFAGMTSALQGFLVQSSNPKALIYFVALLPQFVDPAVDLVPQIAILLATSAIIEFAVLGGYSWAALRSHRYFGDRGRGIFGRLAGAFMIFVGLRLTLFDEL